MFSFSLFILFSSVLNIPSICRHPLPDISRSSR